MLLVTGITGHSGKYFLEELINNKYEGRIRCIIRESSDTMLLDNSGLNIEKMIGNLNDPNFLDKVMQGVNTIVHIAGISYSMNIIKSAINCGVNRAILVHTTGIYSRFKSASHRYKNIESEIKSNLDSSNNNLNLTILRPTMIYGDLCDLNMSKFIKMVDRLRIFPVINNGKGLIQPVNARDLGIAYYRIMNLSVDKAKREYILSGERPIAMHEVFYEISNSLNKKTLFLNVPLEIGVFLAKSLKVFSIGKVDYIEKVQRMSEDRNYEHNDAKKDFGYNPVSFREGIANEVKQYLASK